MYRNMAVTPEGKVKRAVRVLLNEFAESIMVNGISVFTLKQYWPVPSGFGASDLDVLVCYYGVYIAIETKAPDKKPTPRQEFTIAETLGAGGIVHVVKDPASLAALRQTLEDIRERHAGNASNR